MSGRLQAETKESWKAVLCETTVRTEARRRGIRRAEELLADT